MTSVLAGTSPKHGFGARHPVLAHMAVAVFSLGLVSIAVPPVDAAWLGFLAFIPWMAWHGARPRRGTARALMAAYYLHFASVLWWTAEITIAGPLLIPILGMPFVFLMAKAFDSLIHRRGLPGVIVYPLGIVASEVLRDQCLGLTWSSIGYTQVEWTELIQIASVFRVHGVSFALLVFNAAIAGLGLSLFRERRLGAARRAALPVLSSLVLFLALHLWGRSVIEGTKVVDGPLALGIQGNLPPLPHGQREMREVFNRYRGLLDGARARGIFPDLLVFAETSFPSTSPPEHDFDRVMNQGIYQDAEWNWVRWRSLLAQGRGQQTVFGQVKRRRIAEGESLIDEDRDGKQEWNVAVVADIVNECVNIVAESEKTILVPFGETIPLPLWTPGRDALKAKMKAIGGFIPDTTVGTSRPLVPFEHDGRSLRYGIHICYEIVFPEESRGYVQRGADFLINISNDGWFGNSSEMELVNTALRFRAVENRRAILRVSNTGISTLVDPFGRELATVKVDGRRKGVAGILAGKIPLAADRTAYVRYGDLPALAFVPLFVVLFLLRKPKPPANAEFS